MRVFKWKEFILELDYGPFLTSTERSFVIIDAVLSLLRSVFNTIAIRVLLLCLQNQFLILLVNTVLSFTVNKEIAAIDESSSSVSCWAAGFSVLVVRRFGFSSTQACLAASFQSRLTPGSAPGLAERSGVRAPENRCDSSRSLQVSNAFFFPTFFVQSVKGARCCSSSPLVCEHLSHGCRSPVRSMLIQSWSDEGLNSGTSQTAWNPVINESVSLKLLRGAMPLIVSRHKVSF